MRMADLGTGEMSEVIVATAAVSQLTQRQSLLQCKDGFENLFYHVGFAVFRSMFRSIFRSIFRHLGLFGDSETTLRVHHSHSRCRLYDLTSRF